MCAAVSVLQMNNQHVKIILFTRKNIKLDDMPKLSREKKVWPPFLYNTVSIMTYMIFAVRDYIEITYRGSLLLLPLNYCSCIVDNFIFKAVWYEHSEKINSVVLYHMND